MDKCKKHPQYKVVRKPTANCEKCKELWGKMKLFRLQREVDSTSYDECEIRMYDIECNTIYLYSTDWFNIDEYGKGKLCE